MHPFDMQWSEEEDLQLCCALLRSFCSELSKSVKGGPRHRLSRPRAGLNACVSRREPAVARLVWLACSPRCRPYFGQAADVLAAGRSNPPLSDVVFHARCQRRLPFIGARPQAVDSHWSKGLQWVHGESNHRF